MDATRLQRLAGIVQPYAWGSPTAIPELLGTTPTGKPQAELWLGAHPVAPSAVDAHDGERVALDAWIRSDPERVLGVEAARRFGAELPFLLKVLAAARPLSIQAHPNAEQARAGFAREDAAGIPRDAAQRCYRDPRPKPELICALTPFRALNRFREPTEIARRIAALGVPELEPFLTPLREMPNRAGLEAFFRAWMNLDREARAPLIQRAAAAACRTAEADRAHAEVVRLASAHPADSGALAPLFLNLVELAPGDAMFLPAGELHSYLDGTGIEVMASSDNVLRGGLTEKHVDLAELTATLTFRSGDIDRLRPTRIGPAESSYSVPAEEFALSVLRLEAGSRWEAPRERGAEILLCTEGRARTTDAKGRVLDLARGAAALAPAAAGAYCAQGEATLYRASVGVESRGSRERQAER